MDGTAIAAKCAEALAEATRAAARRAEAELGPPPLPYALLLLGSGGRGEALFAADQDNAMVCAGDDPWFAEAASRISTLLDQAGVPFCKGGVMASNPLWRRSLEGWRAAVDGWIADPYGQQLLNVDIFCDFRAVWGELSLAEAVRQHLRRRAQASPLFLMGLATKVAAMRAPMSLLGRFLTRQTRLDLKTGGLLPLVSAVRVLALKHGITATATTERLDALAAAGSLPEREARSLADHHALLLGLLAEQQTLDAQAGLVLSNRVELRRLSQDQRRRLKKAFAGVNSLTWVMRHALSTV